MIFRSLVTLMLSLLLLGFSSPGALCQSAKADQFLPLISQAAIQKDKLLYDISGFKKQFDESVLSAWRFPRDGSSSIVAQFSVGKNQPVQGVIITKASGYADGDRSAIQAIHNAKLPEVPAEMPALLKVDYDFTFTRRGVHNRGATFFARAQDKLPALEYVCSQATPHQMFNNEGVKYFLNGDVDKAIASFRQSIESDPAYSAARHNLAIAYDAHGMKLEKNVPLAQKAFRASIYFEPEQINAYLHLERVLDKAGLNSKSYAVRKRLGDKYQRRGDIMSAVAEYRCALRLKWDKRLSQALGSLTRTSSKELF